MHSWRAWQNGVMFFGFIGTGRSFVIPSNVLYIEGVLGV